MATPKTKAGDNTPTPLKDTGRRFADVVELVRASEGEAGAKAFEEYQAARRVVNLLASARVGAGLTQAQLGERLGWTQSKVSKFEASADANLGLLDVAAYVDALGVDPVAVLLPPRGPGKVRGAAAKARR